ncbi:hypothetical protein ACTA71_002766 [Dictyostelium dimigraforme]
MIHRKKTWDKENSFEIKNIAPEWRQLFQAAQQQQQQVYKGNEPLIQQEFKTQYKLDEPLQPTQKCPSLQQMEPLMKSTSNAPPMSDQLAHIPITPVDPKSPLQSAPSIQSPIERPTPISLDSVPSPPTAKPTSAPTLMPPIDSGRSNLMDIIRGFGVIVDTLAAMVQRRGHLGEENEDDSDWEN